MAQQLSGVGNMSIRVISEQGIYRCFLEFRTRGLCELFNASVLVISNRVITEKEEKEKKLVTHKSILQVIIEIWETD